MPTIYTRNPDDDNFYDENGKKAPYTQGLAPSGFAEPEHFPHVGQLTNNVECAMTWGFDYGYDMWCMYVSIFTRLETWQDDGDGRFTILINQEVLDVTDPEPDIEIPLDTLPDKFFVVCLPEVGTRFNVWRLTDPPEENCNYLRWTDDGNRDYWARICDCPHEWSADVRQHIVSYSTMFKFLFPELVYRSYVPPVVAAGCAAGVVGGLLLGVGSILGAQIVNHTSQVQRKRRVKKTDE